MTPTQPSPYFRSESGNILIYILLGIVLIGLLTVALRQGGDPGKDLDGERMTITASQVQDYASLLQGGVNSLIERGVSEADLRFAHPKNISGYGTITTTPTNQVFHPDGANVAFKLPPANVNDGSRWEVIGNLAIPHVGSDRPELVAILPNVTQQFCTTINRQLGVTIENPIACTFLPATQFMGTYPTSPVTYADTVFSKSPVLQGCAECGDGSRYYFYVLLSR